MKHGTFLNVILILIAGLLYASSGFFVSFFISGIFITLLVAQNKIFQALAVSVFCLAVCFFTGRYFAVNFLLGGILPGIAIGLGYRFLLPLNYLMIAPSLCFAADWAYIFFSYKAAYGTSMFTDASNKLLDYANSASKEITAHMPTADSEQYAKMIHDSFASAMSIMNIIVPAMIILSSSAAAFIIIMLTKKLVFRYAEMSPVISFSEIYAPSSLTAITLVSGILCIPKNNSVVFFFGNIVLIFSVYFALCGFSVLDYFFRKRVSYAAMRFVIYMFALMTIFMIFPQVVYIILFTTGMSDTVFDFRKLRHPDKPSDDGSV
ncbi:MAG: DUF2232 domain-containing protein [Bacillota bacterium]|nr:DUF2232 domain-containing protein [Bacillota bacterium]